MFLPASDIAGRLAQVRARIARAAALAGRRADEVTLVAVSKFQPREAVDEAWRSGQRRFGENRVQEAAGKFGSAARKGAGEVEREILHLIGALQTNKAREAIRVADVIETLDRERLAVALGEAAEREGRLPSLLVQVNVGDEPQKAGVPRASADAFIRACRSRFGEALRGLMCIPPAGVDPTPHFRYLATLASVHGLPTLSMGMSDDCEAAIAAGATEVRIGTAIFGHRPDPGPSR